MRAPGEMAVSNVDKAWYGMAGEAPEEREVMEAPEVLEMPDMEAPEVEMDRGTETVTMAGREWTADWTEVNGSKSWIDQATGLVIRTDFEGATNRKLTAYGTDAEPMLDWDI